MQRILKLLQNSKIVDKFEILDFKSGKDFYYIKIKLEIKNSTELHIKEYISLKEVKYSYHWQEKNRKLIIRWDNAPHQNVKTFPHHKHLSDGTVVESYTVSLHEILKDIEMML